MAVVTTLDVTKLEMIQRKVNAEAPYLVQTMAKTIEANAKMLAPVLTGFMRSSINSGRVSPLAYRVNVFAAYGVFVELGTSKMAAQPFLTPSVEHAMNTYIIMWKRLVK